MGTEAVTQGLQPPRIRAAREPVGQRGERKTVAQRLAFDPFVAIEPNLPGPRGVGAELDEPGTEVRVEDVEVVDPDAALLLEEVQAHRLTERRAVAGADHPLELLASDDRDDAKAALALGPFQVGADVIELAIIPARPIRLFQPQHGNLVGGRERADLAAEPIADPLKQRCGRDLVAQMPTQEAHNLATDLQIRHVRVQVQPIDTLDLERHMTLEHIVDVRHARHHRMVNATGRLCPPDPSGPRRGEAGRGARPPPANAPPVNVRPVRRLQTVGWLRPRSLT